ncbi:MAG TPA: carbohydrate kinase family protein [Streptosporangiaceae bacterium]|nr:carbohydrate kinase family protein [Streptosporangiaceae bacterium]
MICTLGDVLLDVVAVTREPVRHGTDTLTATVAGAGGQAANVAAWVVALGGRARLVAKRSRDLAGRMISEDLARRGVEVCGPLVDGSTGVVVSVSESGGERTMLTDRGVCPLLAATELDDAWFAGCDRLHLPLYSMVDAPIRGAALAAAQRVPRVSVDLSSVSVLREIGAAEVRRLLGQLRPEVIFGTEPEMALALPATITPVTAALDLEALVTEAPDTQAPGTQALGTQAPGTQATVIVKLGAAGVRVNGEVYPARPAWPVDSTGAGDAFAAGFLCGGLDLALDAAARAVSRLGAMP